MGLFCYFQRIKYFKNTSVFISNMVTSTDLIYGMKSSLRISIIFKSVREAGNQKTWEMLINNMEKMGFEGNFKEEVVRHGD